MILHRYAPLLSFIWPGGLIFLAGLGFLRPTGLPHWAQPLIHVFPYVVLVFGLLLCWIFDRSRIGLSLLILILGDQSFLWMPPVHTGIESSDSTFQITALLIPLNLLLLTLAPHEAIVTRTTLLWSVFILFQTMVAAWLAYSSPMITVAALNIPFLPSAMTTGAHLTQPVVLAWGTALMLLITHALLTDSETEKGFVWAYIAVGVALYSGQVGWEPRPFLALAGMIIIVSLMQTSYRSSFRDETTNLPGSRAFAMAGKRLGRRYSLAIVEIDQLKETNNHYGRSIGDQLLALVAKTILQASGRRKVFAHDAEHFLILFPAISPQNTLVSLERVRKAVEAVSFVLRNRKLVRDVRRPVGNTGATAEDLPVTVSIGVCGTDEGPGMLAGVVKAAYQAAHGAKSEGGNIVKRLASEHLKSPRSTEPARPPSDSGQQRVTS